MSRFGFGNQGIESIISCGPSRQRALSGAMGWSGLVSTAGLQDFGELDVVVLSCALSGLLWVKGRRLVNLSPGAGSGLPVLAVSSGLWGGSHPPREVHGPL